MMDKKVYKSYAILRLIMTDLIVCMSSGKGTWEHVSKVIDGQAWNKVFIITGGFFKDKINRQEAELVVIDTTKTITGMAEEIKNSLKGKINALKVAVNFISGEGREHMALVSALIQLGLGIRLMALTPEGVKEV